MNRFSRSSRPTGPKMRVARGSPASLMMTAALSSNRMYDPSRRRISLAVLTTTAFAISPFFIVPLGRASLIVTTITSPTRASRRLEPPSTRMHFARLAPELSAIFTIDSCWIIAASPGSFEDFDDAPALQLGQRPRLHDPHHIPLARRVLLVVRVVLRRTPDLLAVQAVWHATLHGDHHRLLHLVAYHGPDARLASTPRLLGH